MSSELEYRFSTCNTLEDAWKMALGLNLRSGMIKVSSNTLNGGIAFLDGKIVAACVDETGDKGQSAFNTLASLKQLSCEYLALNDEQGQKPSSFAKDVAADHATAPVSANTVTELFQQMVASDNRREFFNDDGTFKDADRALSQEQLKLLEVVRELSDAEAFHEQSQPDLDSTVSLSEKQAKAVKALAASADPEGFSQYTGELDNKELVVTDEQLWMLGEILGERSPQEHKSEFAQESQQLKTTGHEHFRDFVPVAQAPAEDAMPAALELTRAGFPSDFHTGDPTAVKGTKTKDVSEWIPGQSDGMSMVVPAKLQQHRYARLVAPAMVAIVCVSLFAILATVRNLDNFTVSPEIGKEQTHRLVDEQFRLESPLRARPVPAQPKAAAAPNQSPPPNTTADSHDTESLFEAKLAQNKGQADKAAQILEDALTANPLSCAMRIQLIKLYKAKGQLRRARELAILGFKLASTPADRKALWDLFIECQQKSR